jgi:LysR family transcriptional regulator, regulator for genes of the gallate degradation pathway
MAVMPMPLQLVDHLRALRAVCAVDSCGSSIAAAQALHLSQSSVVRAVQALEATLDGALFERSGRGMVATDMGRGVALRTRRALLHLASVDPRGRRGAGADALAWTASRLAAGVGARHLAVLPALAQGGSEAVGGARLGISQSAVHQTLVQLEHMAGAALFVRGRKGLRATEAGESVLRAFKLACAELEQAGDELAARRGVVQGRLVIGTLPFSTGRLLSEAVDRVLRVHPGLGITIIDGTYNALLHQLRHAEIDVVVGALRPTLPGSDLQQEPLFLDQLAVVARARHPLAQKRNLVWQDLRGQAWIMPMPNTPAQTAFEEALQVAAIPLPGDALRVNSALMMQSLLAQSDRLALMSVRHLQGEIDAGLLVVLGVPVQHAPRSIGLVRRSEYLPTPAAQCLLDALHRVARRIAKDLPAMDEISDSHT